MKRYWDHTEIGDSLPKVIRPPISRLQIAQFAAASDEFSPLNLDDEQAKNAGYHSVYAPGLMSLGFIEEALRAFAANMKIVSLKGTFQRLIWPGDRLLAQGLLVRRYQKHDEYRILCNLWCENQHNEVVMKGSAIGIMFKNADHESKSHQTIPTISQKSHQAFLDKCSEILKHANSKTSNKCHRGQRARLDDKKDTIIPSNFSEANAAHNHLISKLHLLTCRQKSAGHIHEFIQSCSELRRFAKRMQQCAPLSP